MLSSRSRDIVHLFKCRESGERVRCVVNDFNQGHSHTFEHTHIYIHMYTIEMCESRYFSRQIKSNRISFLCLNRNRIKSVRIKLNRNTTLINIINVRLNFKVEKDRRK